MSWVTTVESWLSQFFRLSLVVAGGWAFFTGSWTLLFQSVLTLVVIIALPAIMRRRYRIELPLEFEFALSLFVYATLFLGEAGDFYERFWWWDAVLHTGSAAAFSLIGFLVLYSLYVGKKIEASAAVIMLFAFAFAMAIGAVWEIFEFAMDQLFGLSMQKSGLVDTMWDLIVDAVGALLMAIAGSFYIKHNRSSLFKRLLESFVEKNPALFRRGS